MKTRFAKFYNLPELMMLFKECADIQTADMMNLPVPKAEYHIVDLPPSDFQKEMVESFGERAEAIRKGMVDPKTDNMLLITNEGRKVALDQRLLNSMLPDNPDSKVSACAENVYQIWNETMENRSAQLVFSDLSTPSSVPMVKREGGSYVMDTGFSDVYHDLKQKLIDKGIPENEIAFIHDCKTDAQKKELFAKVNKGAIRVLLGSTSKMGAGTNCQQKLIALHDLDVPWRPSDLTQRSGRIIRQGNTNPLVHIFRYVTKETFDSYMYQLVENKQRFISQVMTSKSISRTADDVDEAVLNYAEIKALATGDPRIIEKNNLEAEVGKLNTLHSGFLSQKYELEDMITRTFPADLAQCDRSLTALKEDLQQLSAQPEPPEDTIHPMTVLGMTYNTKKEAGSAILEACQMLSPTETQNIGQYRGFQMMLSWSAFSKQFMLELRGRQPYMIELGNDARGNMTRISNVLSSFPSRITDLEQKKTQLFQKLEQAKVEAQAGSPYEEKLKEKTAMLNELTLELKLNDKDPVLDSEPETSVADEKKAPAMVR